MIENIVENCYNVHIAVSTANIDAKELGIMRFTIRGKNIEVTEGLRSAVTEKLGKLEKYFAVLLSVYDIHWHRCHYNVASCEQCCEEVRTGNSGRLRHSHFKAFVLA